MRLSPFLAASACLLAVQPMPAAAQADWVPGSAYDPKVPTIRQVLGFTPPAQFTSFYETEKLLHRWAAPSAKKRADSQRSGSTGRGIRSRQRKIASKTWPNTSNCV